MAVIIKFWHLIIFALVAEATWAGSNQNRLYEDLMANYNKIARPVRNSSEAVKIQFKLKLVQLLDVDEKNQIVITKGWLKHVWTDWKLHWNPDEYGGITIMHIPAEQIWLPDIILYNNADGSPQVTKLTKVHVQHTGEILWEPPVTYNSVCQHAHLAGFTADYRDEQMCRMKFGSWTYYGLELNLTHLANDDVKEETLPDGEKVWTVELGIDLTDFAESGEWDLMSVRGTRHVRWYPCCSYPSVDITYALNIRRKTLFYTINLLTPIVGLTGLTSAVFYLPPDSNNKITLCISILVSLTVFFLLLIDIIPPTSLVIPLIGRYLMFTMGLVSFSVATTVIVLNLYHRSGSLHPMPQWVRRLFIDLCPGFLKIKRAKTKRHESIIQRAIRRCSQWQQPLRASFSTQQGDSGGRNLLAVGGVPTTQPASSFHERNQWLRRRQIARLELTRDKACRNVCYIADELGRLDFEDNLKEDWRFVAMVIDRIFLIIFTVVIFFGTCYIILSAPILRDKREPITALLRRKAQ